MVAVSASGPVAVPVTTPVPDTEATAVLLLLHVPSGVASLKLVVRPWHTESVPNIAPGSGFTVTIAVMIQLVGNV